MAGERRRHLREQTVDPSMDSRSYQTALLDRYDRQIVLLKSVRYWYVLPIWSNTIALVAAKAKSPWGLRAGGFAAGMTVFCAGIIWLNEVYAVRRLLVERNRIAETTKHSEE